MFVWGFFDRDFCKLAEITNYDFILPSKAYQRHLETRASNFWDLVQSDQSPFAKTLLVLSDFSRVTLIHKPDK